MTEKTTDVEVTTCTSLILIVFFMMHVCLQQEFKSAPVPEKPTDDDGVTTVVGKTADSIVMDTTKDVLLEVRCVCLFVVCLAGWLAVCLFVCPFVRLFTRASLVRVCIKWCAVDAHSHFTPQHHTSTCSHPFFYLQCLEGMHTHTSLLYCCPITMQILNAGVRPMVWPLQTAGAHLQEAGQAIQEGERVR